MILHSDWLRQKIHLFHNRLSIYIALVTILLLTPELKAQEKHNILFIISDDLNTRIGPFMEIDNHTPHLERLAKEGVRFSRAYSQIQDAVHFGRLL